MRNVRSFSTRLLILAAVTSALAVVSMSATFRVIEWARIKPSALASARNLTRMIEDSIGAELDLGSPEGAKQRLEPLRGDPLVLGAYVYKVVQLYARYDKEEGRIDPPAVWPTPGHEFNGRMLYLTVPVKLDGKQVGRILLVYDLHPQYEDVVRNIYLAVLVGLFSMGASMVLAVWLARRVTRPVAELSDVAGRVSQSKDYSLRAKRYDEDELGGLTESFNEMLGRVQERERDLKSAQDALGISEERFRKIVDNALDAVVTMDDRGFITGWNTQAESIFGYLATEAIGHPLAELIIPEKYREAHRKGLAHYMKTGQGPVLNKRIEITALRRGGEEFPVELAITPIQIEKTVSFSAFIQDISARKRAEQEVLDRESRFRAVVDTAVDGIITINDRGVVEFVNPAVERMFGYKQEELLGKNVNLLMPEPDHSKHDGYIDHYKRTGEAKIIGIGRDVQARRKDGSHFPIYLTIAAFEVGGKRFFTGMTHDLTERNRAEAALASERSLLRALIDNAPDCIFIKDAQGRYVMNNPAHLGVLGVAEQGGAEGKTDFDFFPRKLAERYAADDRRVIEGGEMLLNQEDPVIDRNGRLRWMSVSKIPLPDPSGRATRLVGMSRDITELRDARERLEQNNTELTQKNQEMEQFVYTVSHDLKSPIVTCVGFMGLMKEDIAAKQFDTLPDSIQRLERAIARMHQSINDLLELSRVGRVRSEPEQLDMNELMVQLSEEMAQRFKEKGIGFTIQPNLPSVIADKRRVLEVFENLISNAVKYGSGVANPTIEVGAGDAEDEVRFYVRDNGPGIAEEYHARIFGLFQRLDSKQEGTGVGLTIVQRIMEVHGGRVWIESEVGKGATFWLAFPLAVVQAEEKPTSAG